MMTVDDILAMYRTTYQFAKKTGMSYGNVKNWQRLGYIPMSTQLKIEKLTGQKLKADSHKDEA